MPYVMVDIESDGPIPDVKWCRIELWSLIKSRVCEIYYEIHEEMSGYHDLLEILPNLLPGFTSEWFSAVAFPAFETGHIITWKRSPEQWIQAMSTELRG